MGSISGDPSNPQEQEERLELLQWFIKRSDDLRSSYSSRASTIVTADTIVALLVAALLGKIVSEPYRGWMLLAGLMVVFVLILTTASLYFAAMTISPKITKQHEELRRKTDPRPFFSPTDTIKLYPEPDQLLEGVTQKGIGELIKHAADELWVVLQYQRNRYITLKRSIQFLLAAVALNVLTIALVILCSFRVAR